MEFKAGDKNYTEWMVTGDVDMSIDPVEKKLITGDIIDADGKVINPSPNRGKSLQGILVVSGVSFGRTGRNKLLYKCVPNDKTLPVFLVGYEDKSKDFSKTKVDRFVTFKMLHWRDKHPEGQIIETIGTVDNIDAYTEYQLRCRDISVAIQKFNKDVYKKVTQLSVKASSNASIPCICRTTYKIKDRSDTPRHIISIDPDGCVDIDDAFEIAQVDENTIALSIYISNVPLTIDYLNLWEHMPRRVSTIYLPDRKRPMLPTTLSEGLSSLKEGTQRVALALDIVIDKVGEKWGIKSSTFEPCLIRVNKNYVYDSGEMKQDRSYQLAMDIIGQVNEEWKSYGSPLVDDISDSHKLVEWMMIYYNVKAAECLKVRNMGIFRSLTTSQSKTVVPSEISNFVKGWHSSGGNYTREATVKHDIIGEIYAHTTSPIRRLVDFINVFEINRTCGILYHNLNQLGLLTEKEDIAWLNQQMKGIRRVQNEVKLLDAMIKNDQNIRDNPQEGYIVDTDDTYATVYFSERGFVSSYKYGASRPQLYAKNKFMIHIFNDEHNLKQKVRISVHDE